MELHRYRRTATLKAQQLHHSHFHSSQHSFPLSAQQLNDVSIWLELHCYSYNAKRIASHPFSHRVQELCESQGGRPGLSVLTSLMVSVDIKQY